MPGDRDRSRDRPDRHSVSSRRYDNRDKEFSSYRPRFDNRQRDRPNSRDTDRNRGYDRRRDDRNQQSTSRRFSKSRSRSRSRNRFDGPKSRPFNNDRFRRNKFKQETEDESKFSWGRSNDDDKSEQKPVIDKEKPNFGLSGKLAEDTNKVNGIVLKYAEPLEARKPKRRWRLYPFKGEEALKTLYIHRQSCYLVGRDRKICDLPVDHPSCSKQHAVLQYRLVPFERDDGSSGKRVRLYIIDLESANGTYVNNKRIDAKKYMELMERDVIKFGFSSREYVLLHENSKDEADDDDYDDTAIKQERD